MKQKKSPMLPAKYRRGFLHDLDGRIAIAQQLRQSYNEICDDCGGEETLSHTKRAMVERFVWLEAILRGFERQMVESKTTEESGQYLGRWIQAVNSLTGLAKSLGLKRQAKRVDLKSYVEDK